MTLIQPIHVGAAADDGTGDPLRSAFAKVNSSLQSVRSDLGTAPHAVLIGDSMTAMASDVGTNKNAYHGPRGYFTWLQLRLGFPFRFDVGNSGSSALIGDNKGVAGETTANMLARFQTDVLARNPDIAFIFAGTNDCTGGLGYAAITANLSAMYAAALNQGALVAAMTITPRHPSGTDWGSASQRRVHHAVNNWIRDKALGTQGMVLIDPYPFWVDPSSANGDARSGYTTDGIHPSPIGAYYMGEAAHQALGSVIRPCKMAFYCPSDTFHATDNPYGNLLTNGALTGTSGTAGTGATGNVASNFQVFRNAGSITTATCSKVARSDGQLGDVQQIVVASPGGGSGTGMIIFATSPADTTANLNATDWLKGECEIEVGAVAGGGALVNGIYLELWDQATNGSKVRCLQPISGTKFPSFAWGGVMKTPPLQLLDTTGVRWRIIIEVDEAVNDSVTVKISRCSMKRRVTAPAF